MSNPEMQMLSDIAVKVGRLEALQDANARAIGEMASSVNRLVEKLDQSDDIAREADQRARSAHHRIDRLEKDTGELQKNQNWLPKLVTSSIITTLIGGGIGAAITLFTNGG